MNKTIWSYTKLHAYNSRKYENILNKSNITGEEMAVKNPSFNKEMGEGIDNPTHYYYYPFNKENTNYLLENPEGESIIDKLPVKILETYKTQWRGKAYLKIKRCKSVEVRPARTMSYKNMIDAWMPFEHLNPIELKLWKIIVDTGYCDRINIRAMSYPGWLKDSPLQILEELRGDVKTVNKPTKAKIKMLVPVTKLLGLNEIQNLSPDNRDNLTGYYEDTGDFKNKFQNSSRSVVGTTEECDISTHSNMTFYNFPTDLRSNIFDDIFEDKISGKNGRIFPLLLTGGNNKGKTAMQEVFPHVDNVVNEDEFAYLNEWLKNHKYYELNGRQEIQFKEWESKYINTFDNTRWRRNYETIMLRVKLYSETQEEYHELEEVLYKMHTNYLKYLEQYRGGRHEWCGVV